MCFIVLILLQVNFSNQINLFPLCYETVWKSQLTGVLAGQVRLFYHPRTSPQIEFVQTNLLQSCTLIKYLDFHDN